jgi:hypothetical protein
MSRMVCTGGHLLIRRMRENCIASKIGGNVRGPLISLFHAPTYAEHVRVHMILPARSDWAAGGRYNRYLYYFRNRHIRERAPLTFMVAFFAHLFMN